MTCPSCDGTGRWLIEDTETPMQCPTCEGSGTQSKPMENEMTDKPPVAPIPGHWCRRRDGMAFRQDEAMDPEAGVFIGPDGEFRENNGHAIAAVPADCIGIIGPICDGCTCDDGRCHQMPQPCFGKPTGKFRRFDVVEGRVITVTVSAPTDPGKVTAEYRRLDSNDPYFTMHWIKRDGVRQAVVPLFGARPEFIRDDDLVRLQWNDDWLLAEEWVACAWEDNAAVILRARDDRNGGGEA